MSLYSASQHAACGMDNWLLDAGNDVIRDYIQHGHVDQGKLMTIFSPRVSMETWVKMCGIVLIEVQILTSRDARLKKNGEELVSWGN